MTLHLALIIQTVVGVLGIVPAYLLGMATVMSAAAANKTPKLGATLLVVGLALPVTLVISLIAMWVAHAFAWESTATAFILVPWIHFVLLVGGMLILFQRQG
jgi:hypothetical protein